MQRDPFTGKVHGAKISSCAHCGRYPSLVAVATRLCGREGCRKSRRAAWIARKKAS